MIVAIPPSRAHTVLRGHSRSLQTTGQTLVEFALVVPLLLTIFFGIIELGVLFSVYVGLTNSTREGARAGSTYQFQCAPGVDCKRNKTVAELRNAVDDGREIVINQAIDATLHPLIDPSDLVRPTPFPTYMPDPSTNVDRYGDQLIVELAYQHRLFFDLLGGPTITLRSSSTMRIEPGGR